ncbi:enoyl-CoA hydratase-related protein [Chloroflexota bacterium]
MAKWTPWENITIAGLPFKQVIYEKKYHTELMGGVARIIMNRPDQMNNFSPIMNMEMGISFSDADDDPMIGAVVLTGAGDRYFGTGGDVAGEREAFERGEAYGVAGLTKEQLGKNSTTIGKPVIARINGFCIGGSNHIAAQCDFSIAAEYAVFGSNGPRVGSIREGKMVTYLAYRIGDKRARELTILCQRYSAQEALEMGLVNKVVRYDKLDEEVDKWCEQILLGCPTVVMVRKKSYDRQDEEFGKLVSPERGHWSPGFMGSPEQLEGSAAFMQGRQTAFWKVRKELGAAATKMAKKE